MANTRRTPTALPGGALGSVKPNLPSKSKPIEPTCQGLAPPHKPPIGFRISKPPLPGDRLLKVCHLVKLLAKADRSVRYMSETAVLPAIKVGREWRFWESEILQYLENNRAENLLGK